MGGGEDKLIKLKRGSYETLTSNNDSIPYGQPVVGDVSSGSLKSGQCGSVMTVGDSDDSAYNSVDYRYYALQSNPQASGIFVCDPNYYTNGVPYGIMATNAVDTGVVVITKGAPDVSSVLPLSCGGTGSNSASGARYSLGLGSLATRNSINLYSNDVTNTLPISKGGTGATSASAARSNLELGNLATRDTIDLNSNTATGTLPLSKGGTGATSASAARTSLGLGSLATRNSINLNSSNVTNTLPISKGGTGATTASAAKSAIGLSNVVNERQYSAAYPPPYPVKSVNGKTGAVTLSNTDVGAVKNGGVTGQDGNHQMAMSWNGNAIIVGVDNNAAVKHMLDTSIVVDYIVEQGVSDRWNYIKWSSGQAEAWRTWTSTNLGADGTEGGFYYRIYALTLPSGLFKSITDAHADCSWGTGTSWASARNVKTDKFEGVYYSNQNGGAGTFYNYVRGEWK